MASDLFYVIRIIWLLMGLKATSASRGPQSSYWRNPKAEMRFGVVVETLLDPDHYHKYIRPDINLGKPVDVNISLAVTSLDRISDNDMEYTITFNLQQIWRDSRLDGTKSVRGYKQILTMDGSLGSRIWVPDTYIVNSHTSFIHDVTTRNGLIRLYPNGTVLYVLRITSRVSCPMNLHKYPMDEQICRLTLESWSFPDKDLSYKWSRAEKCGPDGSVTGMEYVVLSQFNLTKCQIYHAIHNNMLGNHSQLVLQFYLKRNMLFFLMQTYLPSVLLVILSWISFWINMDSVPSRVGLGATTVLSMTTLMIGVYNSGPRSTSYVKAVDFYVCVCYGFIFAALMEYAGAHFLGRVYGRMASQLSETCVTSCAPSHQKEESQVPEHERRENIYTFQRRENISKIQFNSEKERSHGVAASLMKRISMASVLNETKQKSIATRSGRIGGLKTIRDEESGMSSQYHFGERSRSEDCGHCESLRVLNKIAGLNRRATKMEKIDKYSRILFPAAFACFNVIYWWVYLTMEDTPIVNHGHIAVGPISPNA